MELRISTAFDSGLHTQPHVLTALQVASNDNDGVAEALEKYILAPAGITLQQTHDGSE